MEGDGIRTIKAFKRYRSSHKQERLVKFRQTTWDRLTEKERQELISKAQGLVK